MILKIILLIIGAVIGAGFITGSEIFLFFYSYGAFGWIGMVFSILFMGYTINKTLNLIMMNDVDDYRDFFNITFSENGRHKYLVNSMYLLIKFFLLISFYIMIAGFGSYFYQEIGFNKQIVIFSSSAICCLILRNNVEQIMELNKYLLPFLFVILIIFGCLNLKVLNTHKLEFNSIGIKGVIYPILYASYNCVSLIPLLSSIRKYKLTFKENRKIAIGVIIILFALSNIIFFSLNNINGCIESIELPTVNLANRFGILFKILFDISVLIAIGTTAISNGYAFVNGMKNADKVIIILFLSSLFVCLLGFAKLINFMYPLFGLLGLFQIIIIIFQRA